MQIQKVTLASTNAVNNIKNATRKEVLTLEKILPQPSKELKNKVNYMQSDIFWKDEHNVKMSSLYSKLMECRDNIAKKIAKNNEDSNKLTQVQGGNGYTRFKIYLDKNEKMNYSELPSITDKANNDYRLAKNLIYNLSRDFKSTIGR